MNESDRLQKDQSSAELPRLLQRNLLNTGFDVSTASHLYPVLSTPVAL
ncbi:hypothetical protein L798_08717 [Zootermopsis nevadensis]|uniref:Uncharacterized protein n=1 Tax=Zootermopsis nevadensis TaxID=136037 RepID=A0A067RI24_ZOONE|nr:hypothetical protein L798_08717 [Zootermopsis nevadensis]